LIGKTRHFNGGSSCRSALFILQGSPRDDIQERPHDGRVVMGLVGNEQIADGGLVLMGRKTTP
jgi:hypothetical protein